MPQSNMPLPEPMLTMMLDLCKNMASLGHTELNIVFESQLSQSIMNNF